MIDIHSHLLPQIDDGSKSGQQSVAVLHAQAAQGVTAMVLTPHVSAGELAFELDDALERRDVGWALLSEAQPPPTPQLHLGFEIMLNRRLPPEVLADRRFSLAGSRYYLIEFPLAVEGRLAAQVLGAFADHDVIPVVAHVERYHCCTPATIREWRELGAAIQLDATALTRRTTRGRRARELLAEGLADVLAADNHGDGRTIATGAAFLEARRGGDQAAQLTRANPEAIIRDGALEPVLPFEVKESWLDRLRKLAGG